MSNTVNNGSGQKSKARTSGLVLIGSGLLLLGLLTGFLLIKPNNNANRTSSPDGSLVNQSSSIPAKVSFTPPKLKLNDIQGNEVSLEEFRGKVILINNWATWCPPCEAEMPTLEAYYRAHKDEGFVLIAIDAGDASMDVEDFVQNYSLTFPVWLDPQNQALQAFKNYGLPNSYIIDKDFVVRLAWTGAISDNTLDKYVTPLIQE